MDATNLRNPTENRPGSLVADSPVATVVGHPEAEASAPPNLEGLCLAKSRGWTTQPSTGPSTVVIGNEVAATSSQNQQLSLMDTVPVELLQIIMWDIMKEYLTLSTREYYDTLTQMRLVCRQWTGILEAMPGIWANLSLSMGERLFDLALSRSTHYPLTITGSLFSSRALDKLLQNTYRWRVLDVSVAMDGTIDCLALHSVPLLQELGLVTPLPTPHMTLFKGSAPMLRSARIQSYGVQWSISLFSNLHELVLVGIVEAAPDVDTLLEILSNSPKLTRLRIHGVILTNSSSSPTRISLSCLRSLELEYLAPHILKQLVDAIDIPTSTRCSFLIVLDDGWYICYEKLEPIIPRLKALADVSRGTRSTLTFSIEGDGWSQTARATYEGKAQQLGAFTVGIETMAGTSTDIIGYFARQLGQGEPNHIPPALHVINCSVGAYLGSRLRLLRILHRQLPDTDEILIGDTSSEFITDALKDLFPLKQSSRIFPRLSTLTVRDSLHDRWVACWLRRRQERQDQEEGSYALPLQTLRIEGGTISADMVKVLEKLVPNLMLDHVKVTD